MFNFPTEAAVQPPIPEELQPAGAFEPQAVSAAGDERAPQEEALAIGIEEETAGEDALNQLTADSGEQEAEGEQPPAGQPAVKTRPADEKKPGIEDDPYEWDKCTVTASIVWMPGGTVMLGIRNHLDAPIVAVLTGDELISLPGHAAELPLPTLEVLADLLGQLREDLPNRAQAKAERDEVERKKADEAKAKREASKIKTKSKPATAAKTDPKPAVPKAGKAPVPAQVSLFDMLTGDK